MTAGRWHLGALSVAGRFFWGGAVLVRAAEILRECLAVIHGEGMGRWGRLGEAGKDSLEVRR